jgi:4-hydroxybenzoate polyprenyltransferase
VRTVVTAAATGVGTDALDELVLIERRRRLLHAVAVAVRPGEWIKNGFVLAPLVFAHRLGDVDDISRAVTALMAFCAVASAGYLVNDVRDAELDRNHPSKCRRPVAAGDLSSRAAVAIALLLWLAGVFVAMFAGWKVAALVATYVVLSFTYSAWLKQQVILDVLGIAGCFLLRVLAGSAAIHAPASEWLIVCTGALAMFLGFTKRRQEAASALHDGHTSRPVLQQYSLPFLDQMVSMVTTGTVLSYVAYTLNSPVIGTRMLPTAVPVLYGVFRYLYLIYHCNDSRSTAALVRNDVGIVGAGVTWVVLVVALLYL